VTNTILYTFMCTRREAAASKHRARNLAIRSLMRYRCITNVILQVASL